MSDTIDISPDPTEAWIQGRLWGEARIYCEQVKAGAKLMANMGFHKRHIQMIRELVEEEGLKIILEERSDERIEATIYKYAYVLLIRQERQILIGDKTHTALNIWMSGKFFGYSDYEIGCFIKERENQNDMLKEVF